jgi:hypothetical protein
MCDAGFEAQQNNFKPDDQCDSYLQALYDAVGGPQNTFMTPFTKQVADEQAAFTARFRKAFGQ